MTEAGPPRFHEPEIVQERCSRCGTCVAVCSRTALFIDRDGPVCEPERCTGCGNCVEVCAAYALLPRSRE